MEARADEKSHHERELQTEMVWADCRFFALLRWFVWGEEI